MESCSAVGGANRSAFASLILRIPAEMADNVEGRGKGALACVWVEVVSRRLLEAPEKVVCRS